MNKILTFKTFFLLSAFLWLSCDIVKDDVSPNELAFKTYTFAEKPAVVNLTSISGGKEVDIEGKVTPAFGNFKILTDTKGAKFLVYSPDKSFVGQEEGLLINLVNTDDRKSFGRLRLDIESLDKGKVNGCSKASGIYDYAQIAAGESITMDLLDNDVFCNVSYNGGLVSEHDIQNTEGVNVAIGPGRRADLTYTAPEGFVGKVLFVYDLGINWIVDPEHVSTDEIIANPNKYLQAFTTALVEIDVVEN